jgi:hypothetical protein
MPGATRMIYGDHGRFNVLPLLTMTGLESAVPDGGNEGH